MKKITIYIVLLFIPVFLFSQTKIDIQNRLDSGINFFNTHEYQKCYEELDGIFYKMPDNEDFNFYYGRCAFEVKKYDEAIASYERIVLEDSSNQRAILELARAYFYAGSLVKAKEYFIAVLASKPPKAVEKKVHDYLVHIDSAMSKSRLFGHLLFGIQYDTNTNSSHGDSYPVAGIDVVAPSEKSDASHIEMASFSNYIDIGRRGGLYTKMGATAFAQSYFKEDDNNILFGQLQVGLGYKKDRFNYYLPIRYETLHYGGSDYLQNTGASLMVGYTATKDILLNFIYDYKIKSYKKPEDSGKDSVVNNITLATNIKNANNVWMINAYSENEKKKSSTKADIVDYSMLGAKLALSTKLWNQDIYFHYLLKNYKYDDIHTDFQTKREDMYNNINTTLSFSISKKLSSSLSLEHTINSSNQKAYDYSKSMITANIVYKFVN